MARTVCMCSCERKRETAEGERGVQQLENRWRTVQPLPSEAAHEPINWLRVCAHGPTQRCRWAFMSMFKLSVWDGLSLRSKWTKQTDSNQRKSSTHGRPMGRGRVSTGAKGTNHFLSQVYIEAIFPKWHMLIWNLHVLSIVWEESSVNVLHPVTFIAPAHRGTKLCFLDKERWRIRHEKQWRKQRDIFNGE